MSHHFDTPTAREDPRINVCDFYLFSGEAGATVMAMTVNPDAGISAPDSFRDEGLYVFRFDLNGDAKEEVSFKLRFGAVEHADGDEHRHVQSLELRRATGADARRGADGALLASGRTGSVVEGASGVKVFAGMAPDLFAGDAAALGVFRTALAKDNRFAAEAWQNRKNFFANRNVTAIVVEAPNTMIGRGRIHGWATASLYGHAPEMQVSRWGLPLITNVFIPDEAVKETYNRIGPGEDMEQVGPAIAAFAERVSTLAGSTANPAEYAEQVMQRLCPVMLPYEIGSEALFGLAAFNGRALTDDVMDVMLTLASNTALTDGVAPDRGRVRPEFPYFGPAYTLAEQAGVVPARKPGQMPPPSFR
jgi:hypothetical protein